LERFDDFIDLRVGLGKRAAGVHNEMSAPAQIMLCFALSMERVMPTMPSWLPKAGVVAAVAIGGAWYVTRPSSYEECMLAEMRGQ
jgi:hypothetical protein